MPFGLRSWLSKILARHEPAPVKAPRAAKKAPEPYHAVSIKPGQDCCEAAAQLGGIRFLPARAPALPLPNCRAAVCRCSYQHFADRRAGDDRRGQRTWRERQAGKLERRQLRKGRRARDPIS
jgi:hypothetical protein